MCCLFDGDEQIAAMYHPDKAAEGEKEASEAKFQELGEAYEVLCDEQKKSLYDQGHDYEDIQKHFQQQAAQQNNPFQQQGFHFRWG